MSDTSRNPEISSCGCQQEHGAGFLPRPVLITVSGILTALGFLLTWLGGSLLWQTTALLIATIAGGLLVFPAALGAVRKRKLDMNVLMTVAVVGAWVIGEQAEAAAVVFLFALSEWLESLSSDRARQAIRSLMSLAPETALRKSADGSAEEVEASSIEIGDEIVVRSGQRIPLDGQVTDGHSSVNQAPITGESAPVQKEVGDMVFAGTVNGTGFLEVQVLKRASDSTLARIIQLVEEAEETRAPTQRFVDRFAAIYTPAVFAVAFLTAVAAPLFFGAEWQPWIYRALVLLVIACPCALVIATPVSIVSGLTALARRGVLVKGGTHLEALGRLRALAVDKTGTITEGKPRVVEVLSLSEVDSDRILTLAAAVDRHSAHPIARALLDLTREKELSIPAATAYGSFPGEGAEAGVEGRRYFVGNHRLAHSTGLCDELLERKLAELAAKGLSVAILGVRPHGDDPGHVLGVISIGDTLRPDARDALEKLRTAGIERIVMISGDNQRTVNVIAEQAGLDEAFGDMLPETKVERVRALLKEHGEVGMVGDGVNDAPALAVATVGIAMGAIGSDTAIETADVALMNDDLGKLTEAIELGRRTLRVIRFNIAFALLVKAVFLVLTFAGHASLWMAILADTGATLLVILNSLRLLGRNHTP